MKILITGAAGFIGSNFVHWLLANTDHTVIGVDNMSGGYKDNMPKEGPRFCFYEYDVLYDFCLEDIFSEHKPDICYHMAAYASEGRSNSIRTFIHFNNTLGTTNVINACVNHNVKLVFLSSVAVYSGQPPFNEWCTIPNPIDEYGLSKLMSEKSIEIAGNVQGLEWCIIRPRNVYGERQNLFDPTRNLFGIMCYNALKGLPIKIFGDGKNKRSFTYIGDILEPLYNAREVRNRIINLGTGDVYTINEAAEAFSEITGYKNITHVEPRHEVAEAFCATAYSIQALGFEDKTNIKEGIEKMWEWAKVQPMRDLVQPPKLEVTKNIHSSLK